MKLAFLGSGAFGLPTLRVLAREHTITRVVSQPDRPAGRGSKLTPTPIAAWAAEHLPGVPVLKPERINADEVVSQLRDPTNSAHTEPWVVIAFGQKIGRTLLADRFAINLHASLLPRWRGAAPINAAILAGDAETGNSVITLADRMDAGLVLGQSRRPIEPTHTAGELHDLLAEDGPELVLRVLEQHAASQTNATEQDESLVTLASKLSRADGWIDPAAPADESRRRINGLSPWPGVQATIDSTQLKLLRADAEQPDTTLGPPGQLLDPATGLFACGGGGLRLLEVQPAGKRAMPWADFARGRQIQPGAVLAPIGGPAAC